MASPADTAAERTQSEADATASEMAVRLLRRDIVSGALEPDSKLKLRILKERYGIGASPMREALAQLVAQGLVQQLSQKGFRVPPLSAQHLTDITRSRQLVETDAVKLAIEHGDAAWEDEIVASFHLLERMYRRLRGATAKPDMHEFESRHQRFHRALIAACPLRAVKEFCDQLYTQATRYRLLLQRYGFTRDVVVAEHRILMRAVLGRNKAEAAKALSAHIGITADILLGELAGQAAGRTPAKTGRKPATRSGPRPAAKTNGARAGATVSGAQRSPRSPSASSKNGRT
ncbi:MAG TPA: FCD domain-containing protein [Hyphomicrobiaceae bacterium]|nr:FCD domain-containing protein [Hyphomicrobiaceae bacterium]